MKGIANTNLKTETLLVCSGFDIRKQDERIQQLCIWNEHCVIDCDVVSSRGNEAKFRIKVPDTVYFYPQKLQVQ